MLAKGVIGKFYGKAPQYACYVGNSGGGRREMMMAQRFPLHFDGIVSGAPILEQHLAQIGSMQMAAVLSKCDALDGVADGLIENYPACTFDASEL